MEWITVSEAEDRTGIPSRTIRRYIQRHEDFLPIREEHRTKLLRAEDVDTLLGIRAGYADGLTGDQVEERLGERFNRTLTTREEPLPAKVTDLLQGMAREQRRLTDQVESLSDELTRTREHLEQKMDRRDEELVGRIRESMDSRRPWWRFWES